jgi:mRNA interferase HigB
MSHRATLHRAGCSRFGNDATLLTVRMLARRTLLQFVESLKGQQGQKAVKAALDAWFHEAQRAEWRSPADVKRSYGAASIVSSDRVVFNIKGNDYRLVTAIDYRRQIIFLKWIGPHRDYDKIDARTVQYGD